MKLRRPFQLVGVVVHKRKEARPEPNGSHIASDAAAAAEK